MLIHGIGGLNATQRPMGETEYRCRDGSRSETTDGPTREGREQGRKECDAHVRRVLFFSRHLGRIPS